jgi:hypothetical protein
MTGQFHIVAQIEIPAFLEETVAQIAAFLPRLVGTRRPAEGELHEANRLVLVRR